MNVFKIRWDQLTDFSEERKKRNEDIVDVTAQE